MILLVPAVSHINDSVTHQFTSEVYSDLTSVAN